MSSLYSSLFGSPGKIKALPTTTPQQQSLLSQLLSGLGGPLGSGLQNLQQMLSGSPEALEAYRAPAMREFKEQIVPGIAERFSGMGAGAQQSSAFGQTMGQAGAGLAENLALQKAQLQQNAMGQLQNLFGMSQQPQFQYQQIPGKTGFLPGLGQAFGQAAGMGGGMGIAKLLGLM